MEAAQNIESFPRITRTHIPFEVDEGIAERAAIGVIVLGTDHTIEHEFRTFLDIEGVAFYESRIRNSSTITPETLADMEQRIPECAEIILSGVPLDVIAYGCTSASMVIGEEKVFEHIRGKRPEAKCTTPITAAFAAFEALGAKNLAVLTPYRQDVNDAVANYIETRDSISSLLVLLMRKMTIGQRKFQQIQSSELQLNSVNTTWLTLYSSHAQIFELHLSSHKSKKLLVNL